MLCEKVDYKDEMMGSLCISCSYNQKDIEDKLCV